MRHHVVDRWSAAVSLVVLIAAGRVLAQEPEAHAGFWQALVQTTPEGVASATEDGEEAKGFWGRTAEGLSAICSTGEADIYVPGYIWHLPWEYSDGQRDRYNTVAWGIGYGRSLLDDDGHKRSLYVMASADSYSKLQYMAGYIWLARTKPWGGGLRLAGGYTLMLIGRSDKLAYAPLPVALPVGSIGTHRFEIAGAYVPGFEVGFFFARVNLR